MNNEYKTNAAMHRDIAHEQISGSTTEELAARQMVLDQREGLPVDELSELHGIESELYCRANGMPSKPFVTYVVGRRPAPERVA